MKRLLIVFVLCLVFCSSAWGAYEKSGVIYYPTDGDSFENIISGVSERGTECTVKLLHKSGASTAYEIDSDLTVPSYVTLEFENGAMLSGTGNIRVNPDSIKALPNQQIFDSGTSITFTESGKSYVGWAYDGKDGDGAFQLLATACDGIGGEIIAQGEIYEFDAGVVIPITENDLLPEAINDYNVPTIYIKGQGEKQTTIKATGSGFACFSSGTTGSFPLSIHYSDFYIHGSDGKYDDGSSDNVTGIYLYNFANASIRNIRIESCDGYGIDAGSISGEKDSTKLVVEDCTIVRNRVNFRGTDEGSSKAAWGWNFRNSAFDGATGIEQDGVGMDLTEITGVNFDNVYIQSAGLSDGGSIYDFGYGIGLKMTSCNSVTNTGKLHFEGTTSGVTQPDLSYDLYVTGTASNLSTNIRFDNVFMKSAYFRHTYNAHLNGNNLQRIDSDDTCILKIHVDDSVDSEYSTYGFLADAKNRDYFMEYEKTGYSDYESGTGRVWAYKSGSYIDESNISGPGFMKGEYENYLINNWNIDAAASWDKTGVTVTESATEGPHGVTDQTVFSVELAGESSGTLSQSAETTWDGWHTFTVWVKAANSDSRPFFLKLFAGTTEIATGTAETNRIDAADSERLWLPYSVSGYSTSGEAVSARIVISYSATYPDREMYIWNPIVNKGRLPKPAPINRSANPIAGYGTILPGTVYFGFGSVGNVYTDLTNSWAPGSISDGSQATTDITNYGASLGDYVAVSSTSDIGNLSLTGHVRAANSVRVILQNNSGGAIDPGTIDINVRVWQQP